MKISKSSDLFRNLIFTLFLVLLSVSPSGAAVFNCPSGDVACLINAISVANVNGESDTIELAAGVYTLKTIDNFNDGPNGLPSITTEITIRGKRGPDQTIIQRDPSLDFFFGLRMFHVNSIGTLILDDIAVKKGLLADTFGGAGILNRGTTKLINSVLAENFAGFDNGGIKNEGGHVSIAESIIVDNIGVQAHGGAIETNGGTVNIERSTIARNCGETAGGIGNHGGTVTIRNSSIVGNSGGAAAGGISNSLGQMTITNSTIVENFGRFHCNLPSITVAVAEPFGAGGIYNFGGSLRVNSSTIARNVLDIGDPFITGGIINEAGGTVELQNTIVALNTNRDRATDCAGVITSLGNNLIGDTADCDITLQPTDLTGDPGLGAVFTDDGLPGHGHFPIIRSSQARNAGDDDSCPARDQIGNKRKKPCDIGAIEFRQRPPLVVIFENLTDRQSEILIPSAQ
jgi:hypothetical protein